MDARHTHTDMWSSRAGLSATASVDGTPDELNHFFFFFLRGNTPPAKAVPPYTTALCA